MWYNKIEKRSDFMYSKNIWKDATQEKINAMMQFCEEYKNYITVGKTERLCVAQTLELVKQKGYQDLNSVKTVQPGDKVYLVNKCKNIVLFHIGTKPLTEGIRVLGAHIDSPRLDIKQNPYTRKMILHY